MNVIVQKGDTIIDLYKDCGIVTRDFSPSYPQPDNVTERIPGRHGAVDLGSTYGPRIISCSFYLKGADFKDYAFRRDEVFTIFDSREPFYITESRNPGKRWLVRLNSVFSIDQQFQYGFFEVDFVSLYPFAESINTTLDPFEFNGKLQFGQGLETIFDQELKYRHSSKSFSIYNAGDVTVDPREVPLRIKTWFTQDNTDSTTLEITNKTTGDYFKYEGQVFRGSTVIIDGVRTVRSTGTPLSRRTNYGLITLSPGWNRFEVKCNEFREIEFLFRFYYLGVGNYDGR